MKLSEVRRKIVAAARERAETLVNAPIAIEAVPDVLGVTQDEIALSGFTVESLVAQAARYLDNCREFDEERGAAAGKGLRRHIVGSCHRQVMARAPFRKSDDVLLSGHLAFEEVLWTYKDDGRGFQAYAAQAVRRAMAAAAWNGLDSRARQMYLAIQSAERDLRQAYGREPAKDEIAQRLGISNRAVEALLLASSLSADSAGGDADDSDEGWQKEQMPDPGGSDLAELMSAFRPISRRISPELKEILETLTREERRCLLGARGDGTPVKTADRVRRMRLVSKIERAAVARASEDLDVQATTALAERYRNGRHRSEPNAEEIRGCHGFLNGLREIGVLHIIIPDRSVREIADARYRAGRPVDAIAMTRGWSLAKLLAYEFEGLVGVVPSRDGLDKRHEPRHVLLSEELDVLASRLRREGSAAEDVEELKLGFAILAWLHADVRQPAIAHRYLNFGSHAPTTADDRRLLSKAFIEGDRLLPDQQIALWQAVSRIVDGVPKRGSLSSEQEGAG